jgi:antitoxin component of MazEF toxin-antitoxin module
MKEKIVRIGGRKEGVALPEEFLRHLELIPGAEVEIKLDKKRKWIILRPLHGEDFIEHFRDTMESMA